MRSLLSKFFLSFAVSLLISCASAPAPVQQPAPVPDEVMQVRFVHAVPDGPPMDFWAAGSRVESGVDYKEWTDWVVLPAGEREVALRNGELMMIGDVFSFEADKRYWVIAYGAVSPVDAEVPLSFLVYEDQDMPEIEQNSWIRFSNVVPEGDALGLVITTGEHWNLLFPNLGVGTMSEYKRGLLYDNSFEVISARNTSLPALHRFEYNLQRGILYTFIATGRESNGTLEVFAVTDHPSLRH